MLLSIHHRVHRILSYMFTSYVYVFNGRLVLTLFCPDLSPRGSWPPSRVKFRSFSVAPSLSQGTHVPELRKVFPFRLGLPRRDRVLSRNYVIYTDVSCMINGKPQPSRPQRPLPVNRRGEPHPPRVSGRIHVGLYCSCSKCLDIYVESAVWVVS